MNYWLVPCNVKYYDIKGVYNNMPVVDWKQSVTKVEIGDVVYIYVSAPIGGIAYKCVVENINKPFSTLDDTKYQKNPEPYVNYGRYMELRFIESYDKEELLYGALSQNGLSGRVQCQRCMKEDLIKYVESMTK